MDEVAELRQALFFFRSVIKNGSTWNIACDETLDRSLRACDRLQRLTDDMKLDTLR
jgi:hypothetical protein